LAARIEQGASELLAIVAGLSAEEWGLVCPGDGRTVGVLVHHIASLYQAEIGVITTFASGGTVPGLTMAVIDEMNARHAAEHARPDKTETLAFLRRASAEAAAAIRGLEDSQLDRLGPTTLHWDAPLTVQYLIEQHPIAHPYIHLQAIRALLDARA
jgi:hypothetical protein